MRRMMGMVGMVMMMMWLSWQRDDRLRRIPCLSVAATLKQTFSSAYQAATYRILAILLCGWYVIYIQDISIQCNTTQQADNTRRRQYGRKEICITSKSSWGQNINLSSIQWENLKTFFQWIYPLIGQLQENQFQEILHRPKIEK